MVENDDRLDKAVVRPAEKVTFWIDTIEPTKKKMQFQLQ